MDVQRILTSSMKIREIQITIHQNRCTHEESTYKCASKSQTFRRRRFSKTDWNGAKARKTFRYRTNVCFRYQSRRYSRERASEVTYPKIEIEKSFMGNTRQLFIVTARKKGNGGALGVGFSHVGSWQRTFPGPQSSEREVPEGSTATDQRRSDQFTIDFAIDVRFFSDDVVADLPTPLGRVISSDHHHMACVDVYW